MSDGPKQGNSNRSGTGTGAGNGVVVVSTLCGSGSTRAYDGCGTKSGFHNPVCICLLSDGIERSLIVADARKTHAIRRISIDTSNTRAGLIQNITFSAPSLIPPLIDLIVGYILRGGGDAQVLTIAGQLRDPGFIGCEPRAPHLASFTTPSAVCPDPVRHRSFFIGDHTSVSHFDGRDDRNQCVTVAGNIEAFCRDGIGSAAGVTDVGGLVCSRDGSKLYVTETTTNVVRLITLATQQVKTIAGTRLSGSEDGATPLSSSLYFPRKILFDRDRETGAVTESALLIVTCPVLRRLDLAANRVNTITIHRATTLTTPAGTTTDTKTGADNAQVTGTDTGTSSTVFDVSAVDWTPNGRHLIAVGVHAVWMIDPRSWIATKLAGSGSGDIGFVDSSEGEKARFRFPVDLLVVDGDTGTGSEPCAYVCDSENHRIRRVTLPSHLF